MRNFRVHFEHLSDHLLGVFLIFMIVTLSW